MIYLPFLPRCYFYCLTESCPKLLPALDSLPFPSLRFFFFCWVVVPLCVAPLILPLCHRLCFSLRACLCARWPSSTTSLVLPTSKVCPSSGSSFIFLGRGRGPNPYLPLVHLAFVCLLLVDHILHQLCNLCGFMRFWVTQEKLQTRKFGSRRW